MSTEYKGRRAVGFCVNNFKKIEAIPAEDIIDLAHLNEALAEINIRFVHKNPNLPPPAERFTIAEALLSAKGKGVAP